MSDNLFNFMTVIKALTDENRVRILMALRGRELCVCEVTGMLDLSPSTTSKHLSILRQARLIESRKKGKWVYYSLPEDTGRLPIIESTIKFVTDSLKDSAVILDDEAHIREALSLGSELYGSEGQANDAYHSLAIHTLVSHDLEDAE